MTENNEIEFSIVEKFMLKYIRAVTLKEEIVMKFLEKHNININASDGILLDYAMSGMQNEDNINALVAVRILLSMGANPTIKPKHDDIIRFEIPAKSRILLEGICKSFGYDIDFNYGNEYEVVKKNN